MAINFSDLGGGGGGGQQKQVSFSSSGTWTVPENVTSVEATLVGASAGGSGAVPSGAGAYYKGVFNVTPGDVIPISVGAGGLSAGSRGGNTKFLEVTAGGSPGDATYSTGAITQNTAINHSIIGVDTGKFPNSLITSELSSVTEANTYRVTKVTDTVAFIAYGGNGGSSGSTPIYRWAKNSGTWEPTYINGYTSSGVAMRFIYFDTDPYVYLYLPSRAPYWWKALKTDLESAGGVTFQPYTTYPAALTSSEFNFAAEYNGRLFMAGHNVIDLYYSDDSGASWTTVNNPFGAGWPLIGMQEDADGKLWVFATGTSSSADWLGAAYSTDNGTTWTEAFTNTNFLSGAIVGQANTWQSNTNAGNYRVRTIGQDATNVYFMLVTPFVYDSSDDYRWNLATFSVNKSSGTGTKIYETTRQLIGTEYAWTSGERMVTGFFEYDGKTVLSLGGTVLAEVITISDYVSPTGNYLGNGVLTIEYDPTDAGTGNRQGSFFVHVSLQTAFAANPTTYYDHEASPMGWGTSPILGELRTSGYAASAGAGSVAIGGSTAITTTPGGPSPEGYAGGSSQYSASTTGRPGWGTISSIGNDGLVVLNWSE